MPLLILFLAFPLFAQELTPMWVQEGWRSAHYPSTEWYTGFARDKVNGNPSQTEFKSMEKDAQNSLSESIVVHIKGTTSSGNTGTQKQSGKNLSEATTKNYKQAITTASNAVMAKMETRSHFDKETGYIYGFAAVRKKDLAEFYTAKINDLLSFAESELSLANQLAEIGKKKSALNKINAIEDSLSYWRNLSQAVIGATTDNRSAEILRKINTAKIPLENGIAIHLNISGSEYLTDKLAAVMQEKGCNCSIAANANEADYAITIKAKLSRCNKADFGEVYCYANANVSVINSKTKKNISIEIPEAKGTWSNGNSEKATEESFKELAANIAKKLVKDIEK